MAKDFPLQVHYIRNHCALRCEMYPTGKVAIFRHLATPGFPQCDHTVGKLSADAGSLCSEVK